MISNSFTIWRGWITSGGVLVPVIGAFIGLQVFDGGCMSSLPSMMVGMTGFFLGGLLNFASLVCFLSGIEQEIPTQQDAKSTFLWGQGISALVVMGQIVMVALSSAGHHHLFDW